MAKTTSTNGPTPTATTTPTTTNIAILPFHNSDPSLVLYVTLRFAEHYEIYSVWYKCRIWGGGGLDVSYSNVSVAWVYNAYWILVTFLHWYQIFIYNTARSKHNGTRTTRENWRLNLKVNRYTSKKTKNGINVDYGMWECRQSRPQAIWHPRQSSIRAPL